MMPNQMDSMSTNKNIVKIFPIGPFLECYINTWFRLITFICRNLFNENLLNQEEEINLSEPAEVKPVTYNPAFFELTEDGKLHFVSKHFNQCKCLLDSEEMMHTPNPSPFDVDLNTPQIQEDSQDPMKKFFKK